MNKLDGYKVAILNSDIISIQVNLLNRCTSHCKSCMKYTWPDDVLSLDKITSALQVLKEVYGLKTVVFSGGDPIMYPYLTELMDFCVRNDIKFSLITTLITKNEELLRNIALFATRIHVSLDAVKPKKYKEVRGVDAFEVVKENIKFVQEIRQTFGKQPIRFSSTISKLNHNQVLSLWEFAEKYGCNINYYLVHTWDELKMSDKDIKEFYNDLKVINREAEVVTNAYSLLCARYDKPISTISSCKIPRVHLLINANGDLYPCCRLLNDNGPYYNQDQFVYGNINVETKEELIEQFNNRLLIQYPICGTICQECGDRYKSVIQDINELCEGKGSKPLFL